MQDKTTSEWSNPPEVDVPVVVEEGLEDVEHPRHLREDEDAVAVPLQLAQQPTQRLQLAAVVLDQPGLGQLHSEFSDVVRVQTIPRLLLGAVVTYGHPGKSNLKILV